MKRLVWTALAVWLVVGSFAASQRGYLAQGPPTTCTQAGNTSLTVLAGPLNYQGLNPKVSCQAPRPSV